MKNVKRLLAFALTLVMAFGFMLPAIAATGDYVPGGEKQISAENVHAGDTVKYYKVVEWKNDTEGWAITSEFAGVDGLSVKALTDGITDELAAKIANAATGDGTEMTQGTDPNTTYTATVEPGLYYLKASPTKSVDVVYNPAFVSADYSEGGNTVSFNNKIGQTAVLKSSTINFDKKVTGNDDFKDTKPGDIIPYQITTQIPSYGETFVNPTFSISDTFSTGLKLKVDDGHTFTVKYGSSETNTTNNDVTITGATDGTNNFNVAFSQEYLSNLAGEQPQVTITYYGVVTTEALNNVTYMNNKAVLTYSNAPNTTDTKEDITRHYTFTIDGTLFGGTNQRTDELIKIGVDENGNPVTQQKTTYHQTDVSPLAGAEFKLTPVAPTAGSEKTFTSIDGGYITFTGLDAGIYKLVETKAPDGFIKDNREFTVTITPHWNESTPDLLDSYDITFNDGKDTTSASFTMTNEDESTISSAMPTTGQFVNNTRGTELPSTGGIGTTIFYIVGGVMVAGAAIFLLTKRRVTAE